MDTPKPTPIRDRRKAQSASPTQVYASQVRRNAVVTRREDLYAAEKIGENQRGAESGGNITGQSIRLISMYKPTISGEFVRRMVPATHLDMNLETGWLAFCPYCNDDCGDDINACPEKDDKKFRRCPVCRKPFVDPGDQQMLSDGEDENEIAQEVVASTPEIRTLNLLRDHMFAYHPKESRNYAGLLGSDPERAREERERLGMPLPEQRRAVPDSATPLAAPPIQEN